MFLRNPVSRFIGRVSYAMYLFHIYAFLAVLTLARHLWGAAWTPGIGCALAASLFTIGTAALSWHFIESPILGLKDRYFPPTRNRKPVQHALPTADSPSGTQDMVELDASSPISIDPGWNEPSRRMERNLANADSDAA
jgi:peptidoglycan/LPS O-acetylase OafA/YrhL